MVTETLSLFVPEVEIYNIDEAFLNLIGFNGDLEQLSGSLVSTIKQHTGIPVSVGIGATKTLAKIANKAAKPDKNSARFYFAG